MENEKKKVDWLITLLPLAIVVALCVIFFVAPDQSNEVLSKVRFFFGEMCIRDRDCAGDQAKVYT